jgi:phosphomannomutase
MSQRSPDLESLHSDDDIAAFLMIECSNEGEISFSCDWSQDENGITCIANILAAVDSNNLSEKIIDNLNALHESEEAKDQIDKIEVYYKAIKKIAEKNNKLEDEDIVVNPIDVSSLM